MEVVDRTFDKSLILKNLDKKILTVDKEWRIVDIVCCKNVFPYAGLFVHRLSMQTMWMTFDETHSAISIRLGNLLKPPSCGNISQPFNLAVFKIDFIQEQRR